MKVDFTEPRVKDHAGDMSKKWHIYYRVFNPMTGQMETVRDYSGLHGIKGSLLRYKVAMEKCESIYQQLQSGWRPFDFVQVENALLYSPERKFIKSYAASNSVEAVSSEYLKQCKKTVAMRQEFLSKVRGFVAWLKSQKVANVQMSMIDNKMIVSFFQFLIDDLEMSSNTIKKYRQTLLFLWDYAVEKKYAAVNVIVNIPPCDRRKDEAAKPIRKEHLKKLWETIARDPQLELACKLELFCLLRPGREIRFLKVGMIDFSASVIRENLLYKKICDAIAAKSLCIF